MRCGIWIVVGGGLSPLAWRSSASSVWSRPRCPDELARRTCVIAPAGVTHTSNWLLDQIDVHRPLALDVVLKLVGDVAAPEPVEPPN